MDPSTLHRLTLAATNIAATHGIIDATCTATKIVVKIVVVVAISILVDHGHYVLQVH